MTDEGLTTRQTRVELYGCEERMDLTTDQLNAAIAAIVVIIGAITGGTVKLTPDQVNTLIVTVIAIVGAVTAYLQNRQKNNVVAAMISGTPQSQNPAIIAQLPERSWKMNDITRRWCLCDATPANAKRIELQIADAEAQHLTHYQVQFDGGFYIIDYGLLMGGAGNPSGK